MACFGVFWAIYFVRAFVRKILNYSTSTDDILVHVEDVLWEVVNTHTLLDTIFVSHFLCIVNVMQGIWSLKFSSITKSGKTICISAPTPNSGGRVSLSPVIYAHGSYNIGSRTVWVVLHSYSSPDLFFSSSFYSIPVSTFFYFISIPVIFFYSISIPILCEETYKHDTFQSLHCHCVTAVKLLLSETYDYCHIERPGIHNSCC